MNRPAIKLAAVFILLAAFTSAPIWGVQYFINQDGSGHVHSAWLMLALLRGDPHALELYQFNLLLYPNSAGHWLLAGFLLFFSAFTATKLMMSLTYVGFVAAVAWLRWCIAGRDGFAVSVLVGAAAGFNWLWLQGFYNFLLGLILSLVTIGIYFRWKQDLSLARIALLAVLSLSVFWCHILSFGLFAFAILTISLLPVSSFSLRRLGRTALIFVSILPAMALYLASAETGAGTAPTWRSIVDPYSISQWIAQLRSVDSFIIVGRTYFPFIGLSSELFLVFAPTLWLFGALAILLIGSALARPILRERLPFAIISGGLIAVSLFAPDTLGTSDSAGGMIRERMFLFGIVMAVPLFRFDALTARLRAVAIGCLLVVICFQTAALWDFAVDTDRKARSFFAASHAISSGASIGSVVIHDDDKYAAMRLSSMNNYNGMLVPDVAVWDNYELGHYLFPVRFRDEEHRRFVFNFVSNNSYEIDIPAQMSEDRIGTLARLLTSPGGPIDTLVVWGRHPSIDAAIAGGFSRTPVYADENVRIFRRIE